MRLAPCGTSCHVHTGRDHVALAFTYAWMAAEMNILEGPPFSFRGIG
jgi:hypothetical protein